MNDSLCFQGRGRLQSGCPEGSVLCLRGGDWHQLTALNECPCLKEFKEASRHLIGQRITLDAEPYATIRIRLIFSSGPNERFKVAFTARNALTEPAALALLHLLHHLSAETGN